MVSDLTLEDVDLHLQRHYLDALAVGDPRAFVQVGTEFGDLGLLVGEGALGLPQPSALTEKSSSPAGRDRAPCCFNAEMVAVLASNSTFWRLMTKAFMPSPQVASRSGL